MTPIPPDRPGPPPAGSLVRRFPAPCSAVSNTRIVDFGDNTGGGGGKGQHVRPTPGDRVPIEWNRHHGPSAFTVIPTQSFESLVSRHIRDKLGASGLTAVIASPCQLDVPPEAEWCFLRDPDFAQFAFELRSRMHQCRFPMEVGLVVGLFSRAEQTQRSQVVRWGCR